MGTTPRKRKLRPRIPGNSSLGLKILPSFPITSGLEKCSRHRRRRASAETDQESHGRVDYSLLLRRIRTLDRRRDIQRWKLQLEIQSDVLRKEFQKIAKGFTAARLDQDPIVVPEPFAEIYFCRERIGNAIAKAESEEVKEQLELLEDFRGCYMAKTILSIETSFKEGKIEAQELWSLFPIGSIIILQNRHVAGNPLIWCAKVKHCYGEDKEEEGSPKVWEVGVEFLGFNGKQFRLAQSTFRVGASAGRNIFSAFPHTLLA
jgi:hypothetical protein